jgi:hypothetical protein
MTEFCSTSGGAILVIAPPIKPFTGNRIIPQKLHFQQLSSAKGVVSFTKEKAPEINPNWHYPHQRRIVFEKRSDLCQVSRLSCVMNFIAQSANAPGQRE